MGTEVLVVDSGRRSCAIPVRSVVEAMRPLPLEPFKDAPVFVLGVALIRGKVVPVADLEALLSGERAPLGYGRFVTVRCADRRVALAVYRVVGVRTISSEWDSLAPLLSPLSEGGVEWVDVHDRQLMTVLAASRVLPDLAHLEVG